MIMYWLFGAAFMYLLVITVVIHNRMATLNYLFRESLQRISGNRALLVRLQEDLRDISRMIDAEKAARENRAD